MCASFLGGRSPAFPRGAAPTRNARAAWRCEIDLDLFGVETARKDLVKTDPQLQFALTMFPEAQRLLDMSKISATQRAAR